MVDFEDRTGQPDSPESIDEAIRVVIKQMVTGITRLPPELAVQLGVILRTLREARTLRVALEAANHLIGEAADEAKLLQNKIDGLMAALPRCQHVDDGPNGAVCSNISTHEEHGGMTDDYNLRYWCDEHVENRGDAETDWAKFVRGDKSQEGEPT